MRAPKQLVFALLGLAACTSAASPPRSTPEPGPGEEEEQTTPDAGKSTTPDAGPKVTPPDNNGGARDAAPATANDAGAAADLGGGSPADSGSTAGPDAGATGPAFALGVRTSLIEDLTSRWTRVRETMTMEEGVKVFTGVFEANKFGGPQGHNHRLTLKPGREYLFEYRVRFNGDFPFMRGGKLPGLAGGNTPTGCVNTDVNGFSARQMWRTGGQLVAYLYDQDQGGACGNNITTSVNFRPQRWYAIKQRVKLNTGRNHDGQLQLWADGQQLIDRKNMYWMAESANNLISAVLFHSFFGGSTQAWAPTRECSISFAEPYATLLAE